MFQSSPPKMSQMITQSGQKQYSRYVGYLKWDIQNQDNQQQFSPSDKDPIFLSASLANRTQQDLLQTSFNQNDDEHLCCDVLAQLSKKYQSVINEQMSRMSELNYLIQQHSKLLTDAYNQGFEDAKQQGLREQKINDNNRILSEKDQQISDYENKYKQEKEDGIEKDDIINELENQLQQLEHEITTKSDVTNLQEEVNTWKNKYIELNKQFKESEQQISNLETEKEKLSKTQQQQQAQTVEVRTTTRRRTVVKDNPPQP